LVSAVSPIGHFLAFMSDRPLTGYDNRDAISGQPDEEVFLYDEVTGYLTCVSCEPTGELPVGVHYHDPEEREKLREQGSPVPEVGQERPLFDPLGLWGSVWLAADIPAGDFVVPTGGPTLSTYRSRVLTDEGRLFFDSFDGLVPQDANGKADVYEYEPDGVGNCTSSSVTFSEQSNGCVSLISSGTSAQESAFLDASGKGPGDEEAEDVFFMTTSSLVREDEDSSYDVYDAHACSIAVPCVTATVSPPECTSGDSCKAAPLPQPAVFGAPASATFAGQGNIRKENNAGGTKPKTRANGHKRRKTKRHIKRKARKRKGAKKPGTGAVNKKGDR
jgi:hypothetical protein